MSEERDEYMRRQEQDHDLLRMRKPKPAPAAPAAEPVRCIHEWVDGQNERVKGAIWVCMKCHNWVFGDKPAPTPAPAAEPVTQRELDRLDADSQGIYTPAPAPTPAPDAAQGDEPQLPDWYDILVDRDLGIAEFHAMQPKIALHIRAAHARIQDDAERIAELERESNARRETLMIVREQQVDDWKRAKRAEAEVQRLTQTVNKQNAALRLAGSGIITPEEGDVARLLSEQLVASQAEVQRLREVVDAEDAMRANGEADDCFAYDRARTKLEQT